MLVEIGPFRILVDAGLHPKKVGIPATPDFSHVPPGSLDLIILTHCHLDHLGALPIAVRENPNAEILTSQPSTLIGPRMLQNSCNVMKRQRAELNIPEYPLYSFEEVNHLKDTLAPFPLNQAREFIKDNTSIKITFYPAGHIVGAVGFKIEFENRKIFFTGDVLFKPQKILPAAAFPDESFDTIVTETTRGLTPRDESKSRTSEVERLLEHMNRTLTNGGSVLIPTFALGRLQEMLTIILEAMQEEKIPRSAVFSTGLGMDLINYFDVIARKTGLVDFQRSILKKLNIKTLNRKMTPGIDLKKKGIYVVSSGMLVEHTPSYHVAASLLNHSQNAVLFVGYCDPDSPGGKLLKTEPGAEFLFGTLDYIGKVKAEVAQFDLSGHADREELLEFALKSNPRSVVITHGDPGARDWFAQTISEVSPQIKITDPQPGESYIV